MKKSLVLITLVMLIFTSCTPTLKESRIEKPREATTVAIQTNVIDSCTVLCTDGYYIYIMNKDDNTVQYRLTPITANSNIVKDWVVVVIIFLLILLVIVIAVLWTD